MLRFNVFLCYILVIQSKQKLRLPHVLPTVCLAITSNHHHAKLQHSQLPNPSATMFMVRSLNAHWIRALINAECSGALFNTLRNGHDIALDSLLSGKWLGQHVENCSECFGILLDVVVDRDWITITLNPCLRVKPHQKNTSRAIQSASSVDIGWTDHPGYWLRASSGHNFHENT